MALDRDDLLQPPVKRAAYSDRTAWLMAELSSLAYLRFEGAKSGLDNIIARLAGETDKARIEEELRRFEKILGAAGDESERLRNELLPANFEVVKAFNSKDTQAYLVKRDSDRIAVLAFRGTEKDVGDVKTDLDARFLHRGEQRIHNGFLQAFRVVEADIRAELAKLSDHKVYLTGHSLGGALAIIATHELNSDNIAACYTFGSPKVGNDEFGDDIKPPIYRVVNAADLVPRLPPAWTIEALILAGKLFPVPYARSALLSFLKRFRGYRQIGDMRYLTACKEDFSDLRVIPNLNILDRAARLVGRLLFNWKAGVGDHAIAQYSGKLKAHAIRRAGS